MNCTEWLAIDNFSSKPFPFLRLRTSEWHFFSSFEYGSSPTKNLIGLVSISGRFELSSDIVVNIDDLWFGYTLKADVMAS